MKRRTFLSLLGLAPAARAVDWPLLGLERERERAKTQPDPAPIEYNERQDLADFSCSASCTFGSAPQFRFEEHDRAADPRAWSCSVSFSVHRPDTGER